MTTDECVTARKKTNKHVAEKVGWGTSSDATASSERNKRTTYIRKVPPLFASCLAGTPDQDAGPLLIVTGSIFWGGVAQHSQDRQSTRVCAGGSPEGGRGLMYERRESWQQLVNAMGVFIM